MITAPQKKINKFFDILLYFNDSLFILISNLKISFVINIKFEAKNLKFSISFSVISLKEYIFNIVINASISINELFLLIILLSGIQFIIFFILLNMIIISSFINELN